MSNYPPGAEHDPSAPWNARDNEACPECGSDDTAMDITSDTFCEDWFCETCGHAWYIQIGPDPDDARDRMRDDKLTGDT